MLTQVLLQLTVVVTLLVLVSIGLFVGRYRLRDTRTEWRARVRAAAPVTALLAAVLLFNSVARQYGPDVSWMIHWNLTWPIYDVEGEFILWLQSFEAPAITAYFSFIYIYGYVFLLVFPVIAYFALSNTRPLRELLTAYTLNYVLGLGIYVFIVAYGPRNMMPELVDALLYDTYPQYQHLTRQVNRNTNVFPSLHTSLAATVTFLAFRTRAIYPKWFLLATGLGVSVAISTMYLGIHWVIDVVAGIVLAYICVALAGVLVGRWSLTDWIATLQGSSTGADGRSRPDTGVASSSDAGAVSADSSPSEEASEPARSESGSGTRSDPDAEPDSDPDPDTEPDPDSDPDPSGPRA
ncbi:putative PAP2-type phosphatase [Natrialba magadii ATCC 43099]|uniref:PA-phosphatase-like phosphoesterase n=1 Tax=Natrialba magadii (strain ATCC 43099 / DSM 3394 / CCM 3739 / CIP 104546 / IAM 13178 / JCM 8861 / NBRC 102185 / NCIMB 2190 / MS3) TaxID=547559 RepID=D3SRY0_NATMM|nr:putative PAP2-type phosphatase [Natrialba magadii ATCC 43099]ELY27810.1 PA-phosphatase-like phosphoesterase [Natrialba magadii ATCC 43099]